MIQLDHHGKPTYHPDATIDEAMGVQKGRCHFSAEGNKDFLISDSVITFTDLNGKLMALKPDVTLSIVKNTRDEPGIRKLHYNENVYRVSKGSHCYKEIMQVGLEAIGQIDEYCVYEVMKLAAEGSTITAVILRPPASFSSSSAGISGFFSATRRRARSRASSSRSASFTVPPARVLNGLPSLPSIMPNMWCSSGTDSGT